MACFGAAQPAHADAATTAAELVSVARAAGGGALRAVEVRDRYVGEKVRSGRVGLTLGLRFQDPARTLTGDEVQAAVDAVVSALAGKGVEIRTA